MTEQERKDIEQAIRLMRFDLNDARVNGCFERVTRISTVIDVLQSALDSDREDREHDEA